MNQRPSHEPTRDFRPSRRLHDDAARNARSLGCHSCPDFKDCGGLHISAGIFDCGDLCSWSCRGSRGRASCGWPTRRCHGQRQRRRAQTSSGVGPTPPNTRHGIRRPSTNSIESAQSRSPYGPSKQKRPQRAAFIRLISLRKSGAGEGIRTLDPNLGKVEIMVRAVGIEPTLCHQNWILNPARLPVPPRPPIAAGARLALCT